MRRFERLWKTLQILVKIVTGESTREWRLWLQVSVGKTHQFAVFCGHVELRTRLLEEIASLHDLVKAKMREMQTMRLEFSAELQETEVRRPRLKGGQSSLLSGVGWYTAPASCFVNTLWVQEKHATEKTHRVRVEQELEELRKRTDVSSPLRV